MPARGTVLMPVAKLSPISQATISITPWMPKVNMSDSTGSPVKFVMPSQVVQPPASDSTMRRRAEQRQLPVGEEHLFDRRATAAARL